MKLFKQQESRTAKHLQEIGGSVLRKQICGSRKFYAQHKHLW